MIKLKSFVQKDFIIEGNVARAYGGGAIFSYFSTFTVVEMHNLPFMLALIVKGHKREKRNHQNNWSLS